MQKYFPNLVYVILFLLPWQTRYIFDQKLINGQPFEYGTLSLYAVELLVIVTFFLGQRLQILKAHRAPTRFLGIAVLAALISVPFSQDPDLSLVAWGHLVIGAILFILLLDRRVNHHRALMAFVLGLVIPSLIGIFQVYAGFSPASSWLGLAGHQAAGLGQAVIEDVSGRFLRAYGTFNHPNVFGGFLAIGLIVLMFLRRPIRVANYQLPITQLLSALLSFALVITFSRSAWLSFLAAVAVGGALLLYKHRLKARLALPMLSITFLSLAIALGIFSEQAFSRFDVVLPLEEQSIDQRLEQYQVFPKVLAGNILIGVGLGAYTERLAIIEPDQPGYAYQPVHNVGLLVLGEIGILGLIAVILWAGSVDRLNYAAIRRGSIGAIAGISLGTVILVVVFFDHYLWSSWQGLALLAFSMAMTLRLSED